MFYLFQPNADRTHYINFANVAHIHPSGSSKENSRRVEIHFVGAQAINVGCSDEAVTNLMDAAADYAALKKPTPAA